MANEQDVNAQFAELQRNYIAKLALKNQTINDHWLEFCQTHSTDKLHNLYKELHSVAGTSGVLGYDQVSSLAREAESILVGKETLEDQDMTNLSALLNDIDTLIRNGKLQARTIVLR